MAAHQSLTIEEMWDQNSGQGNWNLHFLRDFNDWEIELVGEFLHILRGFKPSLEEDSVIWRKGRSGQFRVKEAYSLLTKSDVMGFPYKSIWVARVPTKVAFFAWEASWGKVLTLDSLQRRGFQLPNRCFLCECEEESVNHILIYCTVVRALWDIVFGLVDVKWAFPGTVKEVLARWRGSFVGKKRKKIWDAIPLCIFWTWVEVSSYNSLLCCPFVLVYFLVLFLYLLCTWIAPIEFVYDCVAGIGRFGACAKACRSSQSLMRKPDPLTVAKVFNTFGLIAKESGKDSQEKKKNHIKTLLVAATDCEPQYLIRLLQTKLRIGLAEQTLLTALGQAAVYNDKELTQPPPHIQSPLEEAANIVKQSYSVLPVYDKIVPALLSGGVWNLPKTCSFMPGVPVGPMLAKPTKGVSEIIDKFQDMEFTCEYKYDGERAQIHYKEDGSVEIYSRNAERNTGKYPDVVVAVSR
ncbi:DNA ligase 1 [Vitis vinifera]|uniref:DNA ligase 1 n=1 Tax=Vitis vinifera TaxID=29760 RepID=A0A438KGK9_VITVI|nr:DNA ligase 1 [Vitis vinifera]